MKRFTLNGNTYIAKEFDFNMVAELSELGIELDQMGKNPIPVVRAYVATYFDGDKVKAGEEIQAHLIAGNKLDELMQTINYELENSDFFQAMQRQAAEAEAQSVEETEAPEVKPVKKAAKKTTEN